MVDEAKGDVEGFSDRPHCLLLKARAELSSSGRESICQPWRMAPGSLRGRVEHPKLLVESLELVVTPTVCVNMFASHCDKLPQYICRNYHVLVIR